jgi:hypothetical protein
VRLKKCRIFSPKKNIKYPKRKETKISKGQCRKEKKLKIAIIKVKRKETIPKFKLFFKITKVIIKEEKV